ncbi:MAG: hypothetical protein WD738_13015 [Pirellulales bacterium]
MQCRRSVFFVALVSAASVWLQGKPARAAGYWNVPSTFCQCVGCGWGAGYHAPLVLGPISCQGWCDPKEVRLPYSPAPSYGCYANGGCCFGQPTHLESAVLPPSAAAPAPVSAIFAPPIER